MAKLYSLPLELQALRGLCDARKIKRHGYLMSRLNDQCFHAAESQEVFAAIRSYVEVRGQPPNFHMMCETPNLTRETRQVLRDARTAPETKSECDALVANLHALRKTRVAYRMAKSVIETLEGPKLDLDKVQRIIADGQASIQVNRSLDDCFFHVGRDSNTLSMVDSIINGPDDDQWIPTTWKTFDRVNGGMPRGGLVTIGGNSGAGKSHTVLHLAKSQAALGYKTVVVPLEMSAREQMARFLASAAGIDSLRINLKRLAEEEKLAAYKRFRRVDKLIRDANGRFTIFRPDEDMDVESTLAACHAFNPDVIYIDYIGLLKGADGDDQWRKLGQISRYGKVYAGNHDKIVAMAAQVGDDGRIRYAQAIKEHSSLAFIFVATKETKASGFLNVSMLKGRNQQNMDFTLKIEYEYSRVRDLEPNESADASNPTPPPESKAKGTRVKEDSNDSFVPDLSE